MTVDNNIQLPVTSCRRHFACSPVFILWYLQHNADLSYVANRQTFGDVTVHVTRTKSSWTYDWL